VIALLSGSSYCRVLGNYRWCAYDLQSAAPGQGTLCQSLCSAVQHALSVIAFNIPFLPSRLLTPYQTLDLTNTAAACLEILSFVGEALPEAVLQLLLLPAPCGNVHAEFAHVPTPQGSAWAPSVQSAIHQTLEARCGVYPCSLAYVNIVQVLIVRLPLTHELARLVRDLVSGMGCDHVQWHWKRGVDCWQLSESIVSLLADTARQEGVLCPPSVRGTQDKGNVHSTAADLVSTLLRQGVLSQLLRVRCLHSICSLCNTPPGRSKR
jgi:hypothetical protein